MIILYNQLIFDKDTKNIESEKIHLFYNWCWDNEIAPLCNSEPYRKCFCDCVQHDFGLYIKINPKWIKNFIIRLETLALLRGKHKGEAFHSGLGNDFIQQEQSTKGKMNK